MIRKQVAGKGLALPAVKQREAPGCRVNGPQTGAQILRLQLAAVRDGLGLPGFQLDVLHISGAVPLVQAGETIVDVQTRIAQMHQKVFLIEVYRKIIGVLYIQMDLHLPEIISVILGQRHGRNSPAGRLPWARQRRPPQGRLRRKAGRIPQSRASGSRKLSGSCGGEFYRT